jgi:hypothetical protein
MEFDHQQVMGPNADRAKALIPKFKYDGGNPTVFNRDFLVVASAYGISEAYNWEEEWELNEEKK